MSVQIKLKQTNEQQTARFIINYIELYYYNVINSYSQYFLEVIYDVILVIYLNLTRLNKLKIKYVIIDGRMISFHVHFVS